MTANKLALPSITSPFIWLPMNDGSGLAPVDYGNTGASWTAVNADGLAWTATPGFFTGSALSNYFYTANAAAVAIFNFLTGTALGVGGRIMCLSYKLNGAADNGTYFTLGTQNAADQGYQILFSSGGDTPQMFVNGPVVEVSRNITGQNAVATSGESHIFHMFDAKNGHYISWLNGVETHASTVHYNGLIADWNSIAPTNDLITVMVRNSGTGATPTPASQWIGGIKDIFACDLTDVTAPWRYAEQAMLAFKNSTGRPPLITEKW